MQVKYLFESPTTTGIFWGVVGGFSLILATASTTNGYLQIVPYFFIVSAAVLTTKHIYGSTGSFSTLFTSGFFAFLVSSLLLYAYILTVINPGAGITLSGHLWRFGVIAGLSIISSSILSFIAKPVR